MPLMLKNGKLLIYNGKLALEEDQCDCQCGGGGHSFCGCDNLPDTLCLYDADDDSVICTLEYTDALPNIGGSPPGWQCTYEGGTIEFYCLQTQDGDRWYLDDAEGGVFFTETLDCDGIIAEFMVSLHGPVYVARC